MFKGKHINQPVILGHLLDHSHLQQHSLQGPRGGQRRPLQEAKSTPAGLSLEQALQGLPEGRGACQELHEGTQISAVSCDLIAKIAALFLFSSLSSFKCGLSPPQALHSRAKEIWGRQQLCIFPDLFFIETCLIFTQRYLLKKDSTLRMCLFLV